MGKNIFFIQFFIVLLSSCNLFQPSNVFDSGKLRGKYRIDISPALRKAMNEGEKDDDNISIVLVCSLLVFVNDDKTDL